MSRRKVQKIMPVSATSASRQVAINHTNSILSDPDPRWVAMRQGTINEAFEKRMRLASDHGSSQNVEFSKDPAGKLSGESDRIGRNEWDENTAFGSTSASFDGAA